MGGGGGNNLLSPKVQIMDQQGVDVQALRSTTSGSMPPMPISPEGSLLAQNEGLAKWVAAHPDRFVAICLSGAATSRAGRRAVAGWRENGSAFAAVDRRARQWRRPVAAEVRSVLGQGRRARRAGVHASRRRREHRQGGASAAAAISATSSATHWNDLLPVPQDSSMGSSNFRPAGLRRHAGGYLPSYLGRTEAACVVRGNANCANKRKPSDI